MDLYAVASNGGHVLITPCSARGRLVLAQLLDPSLPRVGEALLLPQEQESGVCAFLGSLRLSLRRWSYRPLAAPSGDPSAMAVEPIPIPAPSPPRSAAQRLAADWFAMSRRRWLALRSILRLPPGGERIVIPLPPADNPIAGDQAGGTTQQCTPLVPHINPMSTISLPASEAPRVSAATTPAPPDHLPAWVVPATPEIDRTVVGIGPNGDLYIYGDTPERPGPLVPAIVGVVCNLRVSQHGASSRYGLRDYLDLHLATPIDTMEVILRLPCKANPQPGGGDPLIPWSVRSLLGALHAIDLPTTALKLQTRRGNAATFFRVLPFSSEGIEQPEIRAAAIGGSRDDLEIAVNHLRGQLALPPFFPDPLKDTAR
ncbi:MAG: hypothetical protein VKJ05_08210 [Synechococcaceae cyanobacterium]|nr:hypothetical protein [Synechococcaceae cyanobacterium]